MAAPGPNDFLVTSMVDVLALEDVFGHHPLPLARVVVQELDRPVDASDVFIALGYARDRMGWVIVGMDKLGKASDMSKDLNKRKLQFKRILDRVSHARGLELLEARFGEPLPAAGRAVTAEEFRDLVSLANRVSWDARNAHLRATAVRWYLEALIHDVEATLHDKVVLSDLKNADSIKPCKEVRNPGSEAEGKVPGKKTAWSEPLARVILRIRQTIHNTIEKLRIAGIQATSAHDLLFLVEPSCDQVHHA
uniref:Uncharacterized protein n=1 Tax=Oryza barthii TaxID=65489 RepID=A0A0D3HMH6_9ORYZ